MEINGTKMSWSVLISILIFTFWLGGLSYTVFANADDLIKHVEEPAHVEAALATNTLQADVQHNSEAIAKVDKKLEKMEEQMAQDKNEILDAIRSQ